MWRNVYIHRRVKTANEVASTHTGSAAESKVGDSGRRADLSWQAYFWTGTASVSRAAHILQQTASRIIVLKHFFALKRQTKTDRTFECQVYLCFFYDVSWCYLKRLVASARKPWKTLSETPTTAPVAAFHNQHLQGCATFLGNWWFAVCLATLFISRSSHRRLKASQPGIYSASSSVILTFALFDFFLGQHPPVASVTMSTLRLASNLLILACGLTLSRWCVMWWRKEWLTSL